MKRPSEVGKENPRGVDMGLATNQHPHCTQPLSLWKAVVSLENAVAAEICIALAKMFTPT